MFLSGAGAAAGIAMINSVGNLGGFVGNFVIGLLKNVTGSYSAGLYVVGATLAVSAVVTLMSRQAKQTHAPVGERHGH
jgi:ACS family tartrate transporter-like MFS transporter